MKKIIIYLKNGTSFHLSNCEQGDFGKAIAFLNNLKKYFIWKEKICIRKDEIVGVEMTDV